MAERCLVLAKAGPRRTFLRGPTEDNGRVNFANLVMSNHEAQLTSCSTGFRDQDQAAGFAVEPIDE